jgi:hypothetical protein
MSGDAGQTPTALRIARRVLNREVTPGGDGNHAATAAALQRLCARTSDNLRDAMGASGCEALLARALARAERAHPVLKDLCRETAGNVHLDDVLATIEAHSVEAITEAIEALLAALIDILSRLIGEDMAIRLIDQEVPRSRLGDGAQEQ